MKLAIAITLLALLGISTANAQKTVVAQKNQKVFDVVEQMPEYPGGQAALFEFLSTTVKYPKDAQKQKVEGKKRPQMVEVDKAFKYGDVKWVKNIIDFK
jgi:protein TonB